MKAEKKKVNLNIIPDFASPENQSHLRKYIRHCELQRLAVSTIENKIWRLVPFIRYVDQDLAGIDNVLLEDYFLERALEKSSQTVDRDITEFKVFYKWLLGETKQKDLFIEIHKSRQVSVLPVELLLLESDIAKLVAVAGKAQRDRALIMSLWDSACRVSELLNLKVGSLIFDDKGAIVIVDGKTGQRRLRLTVSVPDLQLWINNHPFKNDPNAPLFPVYDAFSKDAKYKAMSPRTVANHLARWEQKAVINKPCNPHAIRHARLTDLARKGFTEMELRIFGGWSRSSRMPEVYIHLSGADVERKVLKVAGLLEEDETEDGLRALKCPRCHKLNPPDARQCLSCSLILDEKLAMEQVQAEANIPKLMQDIEFMKHKLAEMEKNS